MIISNRAWDFFSERTRTYIARNLTLQSSESYVKRCIKQDCIDRVLLAKINNKYVGASYLVLSDSPQVMFYVKHYYRKSGVAKALFKRAESFLKKIGYSEFRVAAWDFTSEKFFTKMGCTRSKNRFAMFNMIRKIA